MTRSRAVVTGAMAVLALALPGCNASFSTANVSKAVLATDQEGENPTTTFAPDQAFYYVVDLANAPDDTRVRAVWTAVDVDAEGAEPNTVIDEASVTTGSGQIFFDLTNDGPWPTGTYRVDLYLDEGKEPAETTELTVE